MKHGLLAFAMLFGSSLGLAQNTKPNSKLKNVLSPENASSINYQFTLDNAVYVPLSNATVLTDSTGWDDPNFSITLPFSITIGGVTGSEVDFDGLGGLLAMYDGSGAQQVGILAPFDCDIIDRGYDSSITLSPISYRIDGSAPNRIFKLEWKEAGSYGEYINTGGILQMYISFQMWVYEGTNVVEYRYGPNTITDSVEFYEGETGATIGVAKLDLTGLSIIALSGPAANPTVINLEQEIVGTPPAGTVYRFTPQAVGGSVATQQISQLLKAYPNPASDQLYIQFNGTTSTELYLTDLRGQLVKTLTLHPGQQNIGLHNLAQGVYLLQLQGIPGSMRIVKN